MMSNFSTVSLAKVWTGSGYKGGRNESTRYSL